MWIVLDANILCADYRLQGERFRLFFSGVERLGARVCVPEVVLDETVNRYRRDLQKTRQTLGKSLRKWSRLTGRRPDLDTTDGAGEGRPEEQAEEYREFLKDQLQRHDVTLLEYPECSHRRLVERLHRGRRPFQESGRGYCDALIWENVIVLCRQDGGSGYLVTSNHRDFGTGPEPHDDLVCDLAENGIDPQSVKIIDSLAAFNAELVIPRLERLDRLVEQLANDAEPRLSVRQWVKTGIARALNDDERGCELLGIEYGVRTWVSETKEVESVEIDDVRELPSGAYLITVHTEVLLEIAVDGDSGAYYRDSEYREIWGEEPCDPSSTAWVPGRASVYFSLVVDSESMEVVEVEIDETSPRPW